MSRGVHNWSEDVVARLQKEGCGKGCGATYTPWVYITDFYSRGRTHQLYSHRTGREHQLLSDGERDTFVFLEWLRENIDIREQYPLDRDITLEVAHEIGVRHPYYPGTHVPTVMTLDFLVSKIFNSEESLKAYSVKTQEELNLPNVVERLELERSVCLGMGLPYNIIIKERLPQAKLRNLLWIRDAQLDSNAMEPYRGFYEDHQARMAQDIAARHFHGSLVDYCTNYDRRFSVDGGTGMRVARMLLGARALTMDFNNPEPQLAPMACFQLSALQGQLRSVRGG